MTGSPGGGVALHLNRRLPWGACLPIKYSTTPEIQAEISPQIKCSSLRSKCNSWVLIGEQRSSYETRPITAPLLPNTLYPSVLIRGIIAGRRTWMDASDAELEKVAS
jgi:hypothetical protein